VVWTDSWPSIADAGCGLICVGAGEERARKVYALQGLRGVERRVGSARGTLWPARSSAGRMVARKARRSRGQEPEQGSSSRPESACGVCGGSPQNRQVTWLSHKTKNGGSAGRDGIRVHRGASMSADTWRGRRACIGRTRIAAKAWSCDFRVFFQLFSSDRHAAALMCRHAKDSCTHCASACMLGPPPPRVV
jgi:hypothetical protein